LKRIVGSGGAGGAASRAALFGWVFLALAATSRTAAGAEPVPREVGVLVNEAFHLVGSLGEEVWLGFTGEGASVLFLDGRSEYLFGREEASAGFEPGAVERGAGDAVADAGGGGGGGRRVFARGRVLAPTLRAAFPALGDGRTLVVLGTPEQTGLEPAHWAVIAAHELFHVFQSEQGLDAKVLALEIGEPDDASWHLDYPFPYRDPDVTRAMHLLGVALFRCATLPEEAEAATVRYDAEVAAEALENLVRILELRLGEPRHARYLRYQTTKEGVARYVERRIARLAAADYEPLPAFTALAGDGAYARTWPGHYENQLFMVKHAGRISRSRTEFYALGQGIAIVLDRLDPDWKERCFRPGVWLDDLLVTRR